MSDSKKVYKKRQRSIPDAYVILFGILILAALLTYLIPAGEFDRKENEGITTVIPDSFHYIDRVPSGLLDIFLAIQEGMILSAPLIFLVLIIGGAFAVIESTGAIDALIMKTIHKTQGKEIILITAVCVLFSIFGALGIVVNAVIAFIPIGIILARSMKLDAIVGVAIIYLGAYAGFNTAFLDPLTTGTAQTIAQLPIFSGITYRIVQYVIILAVTILYISYYAKKIKKNPTKSILSGNPFPKLDESKEMDKDIQLTTIHKLTIGWLVVGIGIYVFGVFKYGWALNEMAAIFIVIAIGTALIARITPNKLVAEFFNGAKGLVYGALIIGMARSIVVILENGKILDTIVQGMATAMEPFSSVSGSIAMFIGNLLFNVLVSSGSGQAVIVMPIMTPLADIMEIPRQVAVQAYKLGDGFTNVITPTSGILMANLAIAGVAWTKWIKFIMPLLLIWIVCGIIFLVIGVLINWGPM